MVFQSGRFCAAVGEDVRDQAHRGRGREDVRAAGDVFLEDVVLDRAAQLWPGPTPWRLAAAMYIASRIAAGALMVMLVVTLSSGMPSNSRSMSSRLKIETPTLPTSPAASG